MKSCFVKCVYSPNTKYVTPNQSGTGNPVDTKAGEVGSEQLANPSQMYLFIELITTYRILKQSDALNETNAIKTQSNNEKLMTGQLQFNTTKSSTNKKLLTSSTRSLLTGFGQTAGEKNNGTLRKSLDIIKSEEDDENGNDIFNNTITSVIDAAGNCYTVVVM